MKSFKQRNRERLQRARIKILKDNMGTLYRVNYRSMRHYKQLESIVKSLGYKRFAPNKPTSSKSFYCMTFYYDLDYGQFNHDCSLKATFMP